MTPKLRPHWLRWPTPLELLLVLCVVLLPLGWAVFAIREAYKSWHWRRSLRLLATLLAILALGGCAARHAPQIDSQGPCAGHCGPFAGNERDRVIHAKWDGTHFYCPAHMDLWADESEALAGSDAYVYCVAAPAAGDNYGR